MGTPGSCKAKIRIALPADDISGITAYFVRRWKPTVLLGVEHPMDDSVKRTHVHLALETTELKGKRCLDTIRDTLREKFSLKGNSDYTVSSWDKGDTYLIYMSKGKYDPFISIGVTHEQYVLCKSLYSSAKTANHLVASTGPTGTIPYNEVIVSDSKVNRVTKYDLYYQMSEMLEEDARECPIDIKSREGTEKMVDIVIRVLKNNRQKFPRYTVRDYVDMLRFSEEKNRTQLYDFCDL